MQKEVGRYECVGDDGKRYTVVEIHNFRKYQNLSRTEYIPTTKELMLANGDPVNYLDDDKFQIVLTDVVLTRV